MRLIVSVIIPVYNAENFIMNAIHSALEQTCNCDIEIIVVDDNSSDKTRTVVHDLTLKYNQVVLLSNNRNKGPSGARNTGLINAKGNYISFLDADDLWRPNHLQEGIDFLNRYNEIDVVFFDFDIIEYDTKYKIGNWFSERNFRSLQTQKMDDQCYKIVADMFDALLNESFMHLQSMIIRSKTLRGILFNEDIMRSEDRDFSIQLYLKNQAVFGYKNVSTGIYYRHRNSLTSNSIINSLSTIEDHITLFIGYLNYYSLNDTQNEQLRKIIFEKYLSASYYYRQLKNHKCATISLLNSIKYGIGLSQLIELVKIVVSLFIDDIYKLIGKLNSSR